MGPSIKQSPDIKGHFYALLFGAVLPLAFAPWNWWPLSLLSTAGLVVLLRELSPRSCFWRSFWFGLGLFGAGVSWVFVSIHDHGQASIPLAALLTSLFVIALALIFALPFSLYGAGLNRTAGTMVLAFPAIWVLGEWWRGWIFSGFPWLYLGYAHVDTWLSGWAPLGGVLGISWITAFSGALLGIAILPRQKFTFSNTALLAILLWIGGWYLQSLPWTKPVGEPLSIGIIQPALPLTTKWDSAQLEHILELYQEDSAPLMGSDLLIWPESAIPTFADQVQPFLSSISAIALDHDTALITGIPTRNGRDRHYYNSVIGLGRASGSYHKQHLVPFGEYVPFEQWLRGMIAFFDLPMSAFSPGATNQPPITANSIAIATAICYEIVFPDLVARSANEANLLLTVSNDTWFGHSIGPQQHFQMARMRAMENRKPLIRATNDGITALINYRGQVVTTIPSFSREVLSGYLTPHGGKTPFGEWGSLPILCLSLLLVVGLFWYQPRKDQRR
ncbi:apolipoprotein N-acyltransferase [Porticoccus sp.]